MKKASLRLISAILSAVFILLPLLNLTACKSGSTAAVTTTATTTAITESTTVKRKPQNEPVVKTDEDFLFEKYANELFTALCSTSIINVNYSLSKPEDYGLENAEPCWETEFTPEAEALYSNETILSKLESFDYDSLCESNRTTIDILKDYINLDVAASSTLFELLPTYLDTSSGIQTGIVTALQEFSLRCEKDVADLIALVFATDDYMETIIEHEKKRSKTYVFGDLVLGELENQCDKMLDTGKAAEHFLTAELADKIEATDFLTEAQKDEYKKQLSAAMTDGFIPAYQSLSDFLAFVRDRITGTSAGEDRALCNLPYGTEYYEYLVRNATGSSKTVAELADWIEDKYDSMILSLTTASLKSNSAATDYLGGYRIPDGVPTDTLKLLAQTITNDFPAMADVGYTVTSLSEYMQRILSSTVAYYVIPSIDAFSSNRIRINDSKLGAGSLYSTLAHEGIPGHLYQTTYFYSSNPLPIRSYLKYPGYSEGWAVYASCYALDSYSYSENDSYNSAMAKFMKTDELLNLNLVARIDIGVNYQYWTPDDVAEIIGDPEVAEEVYGFVIGSPATYLSYYIGYLEINELVVAAKTALGDNFSYKEIHEVILDVGPAPFSIVEKAVQSYIDYMLA